MKHTVCLLFAILLLSLRGYGQPMTASYQSDRLRIEPLTTHTYVHISYLEVPQFGRVACNGLIFINEGEAVVFDTPVDDSVSAELIQWLTQTQHHTIKAVIVHHFHDDCLGGLAAFHQRGIPSHAHRQTLVLARQDSVEVPMHGFDTIMDLSIGREKVLLQFFGEGHTVDNIVSYLPGENVLFGGCLIKEVGAGKGNLADANTSAWPGTVERIKQTYPDLKYIVPGHGKAGGTDLLDYTINLFAQP